MTNVGAVADESAPVKTICQVLHTLGVGGAEVLAARLAYQLGDTYRFVFVCLDEVNVLGEELRSQGFPVHVLARRPGVDWGCAHRLARCLSEERVDLLHAHQYAPFFYSVMARLLHRRPPLLFTEHGRDYPDYPRPKRMLVNRLLLERRDRVVAVGHAVRQALLRNEGFGSGRVAVIYNGVELSSHGQNGSGRDAVRRELGIGARDLLLLQVARLNYLKDHLTAVRTMAQVVRQRPDARLLLVGDGEERPRIEHEIARLNLSDVVRIMGRRDDVGRLLPAADLFLLTSLTEGIPLTLIEAMAAGLPVVSTRVGGVAEVVDEGATGLLAPPGQADALARHLLRLAGNPALRSVMGRRGRERAHALFAERQMHEHYRRLYADMLNG